MLPGQPHIHFLDQQLYIEQVRALDLAKQYATPLFVYSKQSILAALSSYQSAFEGRSAHIFYAMKANSSLAIIQLLVQAGAGVDVVSGGELQKALAAGCPADKIVFSGVGKTRAEMRLALNLQIACFNVESEAELQVLNDEALKLGKVTPISLRINPNVDAKTHPYISTGLKANKFGIAHDRALAVYQQAAALKGLRVTGIDCHIGSQITEVSPYLDMVERMLDLVEQVEAAGITISHLDFGGGLGIQYAEETPPQAHDLWQQLLVRLDARGFGDHTIYIEPGRSLVGNAAVCLSEVLYTKLAEQKNFCIIDAAMNDLPRPALYQAYHQIENIAASNESEQVYDVVGPVCESGDWIGRDRHLAAQEGDVLAVFSAGAYCMSMASNYNTRSRAAEVLVDGNSATLIRQREATTSLWQNEILL